MDEDLKVVRRDPVMRGAHSAHAQSRPSAPPAWTLGLAPQSHPMPPAAALGEPARWVGPTAAAREVLLTNLIPRTRLEHFACTFPFLLAFRSVSEDDLGSARFHHCG